MIESPNKGAHDFRPLFVAGLYGVAAFSGFAQAISENSLVYYLVAMLLSCFATAWCVVDARRRGKPLLPVLQMITFFTWPIAVPIYLISTRKWRGLAYALVHAIGLYVVMLATLFAAAYCLYGLLDLGTLDLNAR
jgi:hypothetical protein